MWRLPWRRELFAWENELLQTLFQSLEGDDRWCWKPKEGGVFSVKSCCNILQDLWLVDGVLSEDEEVVFRNLWKSKALSKVLACSWTLLLDRIPSKFNLAIRRLLAVEVSKRCVFCGSDDQSALHLFLHCRVTSRVWLEVMRWLQFYFITPPNLFIHINCWLGVMHSRKLKRGVWLI